jgi:hypothetical protein
MQTWSSNSPASSEGEGGASIHAELVGDVSNTDGKTHWSIKDKDALVAFVEANLNHLASNATYKSTVWEEAVQSLNCICTKGALKNEQSCANKWSRVCISFIHVLLVS